MPLGFSSRRRASTGQPHNNVPVSSSATIAATSAFRKSAPAPPSLSSAAAAAALRSHTATPEPIANLQTKRMIRRNSQSSNGSAPAGGTSQGPTGQQSVQRRSSSASMTERTFRSPSPAGHGSPSRGVPAASDAPPVPRLSADHRSRSAASPKPSVSSTATRSAAKPAPIRTNIGSDPSQSSAEERDGNPRYSVNFSRPIASPTPPISPVRHKAAGSWFAAPTETDVAPRHSQDAEVGPTPILTPGEVSGIESKVQTASRTSSVRSKQGHSEQGARLAGKTLKTSSPLGSAIDAAFEDDGKQQGGTQSKAANSENQTPSASTTSSDLGARQTSATNTLEKPPSASKKSSTKSDAPRRPTNQLQKQPSVVMEEPELDADRSAASSNADRESIPQKPAERRSTVKPRVTTPKAGTSSTGSPLPRARPASLEVPDPYARSAHFPNSPTEETAGAGRHEPPPRSVSPAKSAMKQSPASSIRTNSPAATFSPLNKPPGSDTSDTMSMTSQDAVRSDKSRKSRRVSFDDEANRTIRNQHEQERSNKKSPRNSPPQKPQGDEFDDIMKPRPALPSFGSVRGSTPRRADREVAEKVTETLPVTAKRNDDNTQGTSSDHALGGILRNHQAQKSTTKPKSNEPIPPEVTTVEGSGNLSDMGESSEDESHARSPKESQGDHVGTTESQQSSPVDVPDIQVLPATPGIEEAPAVPDDDTGADEPTVSIPGGWDEDNDTPAEKTLTEVDKQLAKSSKPIKGVRTPVAKDHSDSEDSGEFSDAAEDPSEIEPFGYASLDAIVESPMSANKTRGGSENTPSSPSTALAAIPEVPGTSAADGDKSDWHKTSAYWRNHKQELERRKSDQAENAPILAEPTEAARPESPRKRPSATTTSAQGQPRDRTTTQPSAASQTRPLKSSMRQQPPNRGENQSTTLRQSMRSPPPAKVRDQVEDRPVSLRKSMRSPPPARAIDADKERPIALRQSMRSPPPAKASRQRQAESPTATTLRKSMRSHQESAPLPPAANLGKKNAIANRPRISSPLSPAADSDSESSFKRKRRSSSVDGRERGMRRSLRAGSAEPASDRRPFSSHARAGSGRWSLRSLSPTGIDTQSPQSIRQSLRGTAIPEIPNARQRNAAKSPSRFSISSFARSSKSPPPAARQPVARSGFTSKIADSDSEDDTGAVQSAARRRANFVSRFRDSDDEEDEQPGMAAPLTPVRGIPRRRDLDQDSTDLDDSSEEEATSRRAGKRKGPRATPQPLVPSDADIEKAMETARQNVAAMTGNSKLLEDNSKADVKNLAVEPSAPNDKTATSGAEGGEQPSVSRKTGFLGSIFGRRSSHSSKNDRAGSVKPVATAVPPQISEASPPASPASARGGKLQRRRGPSRTNSTNTVGTVDSDMPPMPSVREERTLEKAEEATAAAEAEAEGKGDGKGEGEGQEWPLPPPPTIPAARAETSRPASTDGVPASQLAKITPARPQRAQRSQSGIFTGVKGPDGGAIYSEKTGKKKRFAMLRKAFGLHD